MLTTVDKTGTIFTTTLNTLLTPASGITGFYIKQWTSSYAMGQGALVSSLVSSSSGNVVTSTLPLGHVSYEDTIKLYYSPGNLLDSHSQLILAFGPIFLSISPGFAPSAESPQQTEHPQQRPHYFNRE